MYLDRCSIWLIGLFQKRGVCSGFEMANLGCTLAIPRATISSLFSQALLRFDCIYCNIYWLTSYLFRRGCGLDDELRSRPCTWCQGYISLCDTLCMWLETGFWERYVVIRYFTWNFGLEPGLISTHYLLLIIISLCVFCLRLAYSLIILYIVKHCIRCLIVEYSYLLLSITGCPSTTG